MLTLEKILKFFKLKKQKKTIKEILEKNPIGLLELPKFEESFKKKGWSAELLMCPSQIRRTIEIEGKKYEFYLRWRWDDPWTVYCNDIFLNEHFSLYYVHDNYKKLLFFLERNMKKIKKYVDEIEPTLKKEQENEK